MSSLLHQIKRGLIALAVTGALAFGTIAAATPAGAQAQDCDNCTLFGETYCVDCCQAAGSFCHTASGQCVCA